MWILWFLRLWLRRPLVLRIAPLGIALLRIALWRVALRFVLRLAVWLALRFVLWLALRLVVWWPDALFRQSRLRLPARLLSADGLLWRRLRRLRVTLRMPAISLRVLADGRLRSGLRTTLRITVWLTLRLFRPLFLRSVVWPGLRSRLRLRNARLRNRKLRDGKLWQRKLWHRRLRVVRSCGGNAVADLRGTPVGSAPFVQ